MIKTIIFDFDGMVYIEREVFSDWIIREYNLSGAVLKEFFEKEFKLCRVGKLDIRQALEPYLPRIGWKKGVEKFMQCWIDCGYTDRETLELINQLKEKGIRCILCTNNEKYRMSYYIKKFRLNELFSRILLSAELGFLKPEKRILEKIFEVSKSKKNEILFCDDKDDFIDEAKKFGFETYKYKTPEKFKAFLQSLELI